ncbi:heat-inducible transcriptional repressor HrcA [Flexivirga sp. ID2601S]|uniref:Heat-inducible transcription repressor HrcA n=1 Tax=Flexivirga aerilata TaxID=1656889 RepID=A0A849AJ81_9MICO|nr:heat-inducible transcriptional repressor HrcA [Flexivirga aerilata]NNG40485.1 heat-inducible transcriptional repressor HrcA [Flexivirga aerilata]
MSEDRRLEVLRAIVQDFVSTSEPVGSKALLERHKLGVSAATVRNDMAALEDDGLIAAPHTSAGRIPTDAGYRMFVDKLSEVKPLSRAERTAIRTFLGQSVDLDDVISRTTRLLSSLTGQAAVMQYPSLNTATVRHLELVTMAADKVMLVVILSTGQVEQRVLDLPRPLTVAEGDTLVGALRSAINERSSGLRRPAASTALREWAGELGGGTADGGGAGDGGGIGDPGDHRDVQAALVREIAAVLAEEREERVMLAGTANLARSSNDFPMTIGPVLEALEEHVVLLRLLAQMDGQQIADGVSVRIGAENTVAGLTGTSVVTTSYTAGSVAGLGVLGPTRMDYPTTMAAVRAVARYVTDILNQ